MNEFVDRRKHTVDGAPRRRMEDLIKQQFVLHHDLSVLHEDLRDHKIACAEMMKVFESYKAGLKFLAFMTRLSTELFKFTVVVVTAIGAIYGVTAGAWHFFKGGSPHP